MKEILERIKEVRFTTTDEIYSRKDEIREIVQTFDYDTLEVYKWYFFFQLCLLKNPLKELLWNYLVGEKVNIKTRSDLCVEYRNYKERCMKIAQYQKKKEEEQEQLIEEKCKNKTITINSVEDLFRI